MCGRSKWHTTPCAIWSAFGRLILFPGTLRPLGVSAPRICRVFAQKKVGIFDRWDMIGFRSILDIIFLAGLTEKTRAGFRSPPSQVYLFDLCMIDKIQKCCMTLVHSRICFGHSTIRIQSSSYLCQFYIVKGYFEVTQELLTSGWIFHDLGGRHWIPTSRRQVPVATPPAPPAPTCATCWSNL